MKVNLRKDELAHEMPECLVCGTEVVPDEAVVPWGRNEMTQEREDGVAHATCARHELSYLDLRESDEDFA